MNIKVAGRSNGVVLFSVLSLFMFNCSEPGSGVNTKSVTNPGLLLPVISLTKSINSNGDRIDKVIVNLFDKNSNYIHISGGVLTVNDSVLSETDLGYIFQPDSSPFLQADSVYTIAITLSDSQIYRCTATTPRKDLIALYAPTTQSRGSALPISWQYVDSIGPRYLDYYYYYIDNNQLTYGLESFQLTNPENGVTVISTALLNKVANISSIKLILHSNTHGSVDPAFLPGGSVSCDFSIARVVTLTD